MFEKQDFEWKWNAQKKRLEMVDYLKSLEQRIWPVGTGIVV